jgi:hypothetical protein
MKTALFLSMLVFALPVRATPQSEGASQVSAISLAPSAEITAASLKLIPAGSRLIVKSLQPVGDLIEVVAVSAATGVSVTLQVSTEALKMTGLVIGGALIVTTVSAGFILMAGSEALAFIPNEVCRSHIHHRNLSQ